MDNRSGVGTITPATAGTPVSAARRRQLMGDSPHHSTIGNAPMSLI